jgi:hypothetical protein
MKPKAVEVVINAKKFSILLPRYLDWFIDPTDVIQDFPA